MRFEINNLDEADAADGDVTTTGQGTTSRLVRRIVALGYLFHLCVTVPTLLAIAYFGFLASDIYISESRFVVRSPNKPETTGFGTLLKTVGFSTAGDEIYAANVYITSRDALRDLNRNGDVARSYGSNTVSLLDRFNATGRSGSFESLYRYFTKQALVKYDGSTSITTLQVRAYNPADALKFNEELLRHAEALVNRLNGRAQGDLLSSAQHEVELARDDARRTATALANFRDRSGVVDPEKQSEVQLQMISKLQDQLVATRVQLNQVTTFAPASSEIAALRGRVAELEKSISDETSHIAGGKNSLSNSAAEYQRLTLDSQFADKKLGAALTSYEEARTDSTRKQAYLERIVAPGVPDDAEEPRRIRDIFATFAMGLVVWGVLSMLLSSLRDHVE